eukprot:8922446-Lingulodinium_polyedra.AAC.1
MVGFQSTRHAFVMVESGRIAKSLTDGWRFGGRRRASVQVWAGQARLHREEPDGSVCKPSHAIAFTAADVS